MHPLDNPVWHALTGPQKTVAQGSSLALRYDPDFAPFAGLPDEPERSSWDALRELVGPEGVAVLFADPGPVPAEWTALFEIPLIQMVASDDVVDGSVEAFVPLGVHDAAEMLALVARTKPGPFAVRTVELGDYIGLREGGALVAMAGLRVQVPGYAEISAVCTDASHRGKGIGTRLVQALVSTIRERGDIPCLHVSGDNANAIRLYKALGFTVRREGIVTGWRAPA